MSAEGYEDDYAQALSAFQNAGKDARWTLVEAQGAPGGERRHWSSVVLIRITLISASIAHLCPDRNSMKSPMYWDFSSIASLARNLFEAIMFFFYISEVVDEEEFAFRVLLMEHNDAISRNHIFRQLGDERQVELGTKVAADFCEEMRRNTYFKKLDPALQARAIAGNSASLVTLRDRAVRYRNRPEIWGLYDYLSTHAHTFPVSFFRVTTQGRTGKENKSEMVLLAAILNELVGLLNDVVISYRDDHQGLVSFRPRPDQLS
jgi:hypothetical protein